ncbi:MAG: VWA domain-containing protein [Trueperaceae bacterium]|nr:MAG: VWA domain-containing protein [Trueperaceae bacterium]
MRRQNTTRRPNLTTPTAAMVAAVALALASIGAIASTARAQAPACTVEVEPNDTPPTATPIDAVPGCLEGFLDSGDQDAFRWDVSEADTMSVWRVVVEQGIPSQRTRLQLFDVDFTDDGSGVTRADMMLDMSSQGGARASSAPFLVTPSALVFGISSSGGEGPYRVALEALEIDGLVADTGPESDHEGSFAMIGPLVDGARTIHWRIFDDEDATWTLDARAALGTRVELSLWRGDERLAVQAGDPGRGIGFTDLDLPAGDYRLEVRGVGDEAAPVLVTSERREARVEDGVVREREPNDTWDTANELPLDEPLEGQLTQGDVDHFVFRSDGAFAQRLNDLVVEADGDLVIGLYDEERDLLLERRGVGGTIRSLFLPEGWYGLRLSGDVTPYRLSFRNAGSFDESIEREPNDTPETAQPLGDALSVRGFLSMNDVDVFSFDVPEGGVRYRVQALGRSDGVQRLAVLDERGRTIEAADAEGGRARVDEVALLPGRYLVSIEGVEAEYALRLIDLGALDARPADLEARSEDGATAVSVATVETPSVDERARAAETERATPSAPAPEPADAAPAAAPELADAAVPVRCEPPEAVGEDGGAFTFAYDTAAALACGDVLNLTLDADRVGLDPEGSAFGFMWIAASHRGTVIKIDTDTGEVKGEYWTGPVLDPENPSLDPSRTVVDRNGNAWVGNRTDIDGEYGSVVRIGLLENGQCEDRNGNGVIDTSTGLGDVRPWTNEGDADRLGGVSTAEDECITVFQTVNSRGIRHVSLDASGGIWVSGTVDTHFDLLDPDTGEVLRSHEGVGCGGYGGVVDQTGVLWSAAPLMRWHPSEPLENASTCFFRGPRTYAISLGRDGSVWASDYGRSVCRFDQATGERQECFTPSEVRRMNSRGVAVTDDGHVWLAYSWGDYVVRFAPDGSEVADIHVGRVPTGLAVDRRGFVWVTNQNDSNARRIDPATNEIDLTVDLNAAFTGDPDALPFYDAARPYTYSDMTGQLVFGPPDTGTFTLRVRGPAFANRWDTLRYDADVPPGADLQVRASSGSTADGAAGRRLVASGEPLDLEGAVLTIEVSMRRAPDGATPTFGGLIVEGEAIPLDDGSIRVTAPPDLVASSNAVELILDGSGTMGQLLPTGQSRWEAARDAVLDLADGAFPTGLPVALRVYGHIQPLSCEMRLEVPLEPFDEAAVRAAVEGVQPVLLGRTPLADALLAAGDDLAEAEGQRLIVLLTDGNETCDGDPEAAIRSLRDRDLATVNIIGFALEEPETLDRLTRWAAIGGGSFFDPNTAGELSDAFRSALQPEFVVLAEDDAIVARGRVNGDPVAVPSGIYRVQVYSAPGRVLEGVEVRERDVSLTVGLRGE